MNSYLLTVIGTVLLSSIITAILPEGKTATTIKGVAKLACLLAIIAPILQFFSTGDIKSFQSNSSNFSEFVIQTDDSFIQYYSEKRIMETQEALEREIVELYAQKVDVTLVWIMAECQSGRYFSDQIQIQKICVRCQNEIDEEVRQKMWEYLTTNYCSEVLIE